MSNSLVDKPSNLFAWRSFLAGVCLSLVATAIAGRAVSVRNNWPAFVRFYRGIDHETFYQPTARQIAALVEDHRDPNGVLVIVGGSSVMRGTGQSSTNLWTRYLQSNLGTGYSVLNLALNGGGAAGIGSYMLEMAHKRGWRAIYVSDFGQAGIAPDGSQSYHRYLYYDAAARGYLIDWPARDEFLGQVHDQEVMIDRLHERLNSLLNFDELWNYVGYNYFFTVYSALSPPQLTGRRYLAYEEMPEPGYDFRRQPRELQEQAVSVVRSYAASVDVPGTRRLIAMCFPQQIRSQMLITDAGQAPFYMRQLDPADRQKVEGRYRDWQAALNAEGIATNFLIDAMDDNDHYDRVHLSEDGGRKFALLLAKAVAERAKALGYDE